MTSLLRFNPRKFGACCPLILQRLQRSPLQSSTSASSLQGPGFQPLCAFSCASALLLVINADCQQHSAALVVLLALHVVCVIINVTAKNLANVAVHLDI